MGFLIWGGTKARVENLPSLSCRLLILGLLFSPVPSTAADPLRRPSEVIPPGETLVDEIRWDPPAWMFFLPTMSAGELTIHFQHDTRLDGRTVHQIKARAVSTGFFPKLTGVTFDHSFESIVDADRFCSLRI